MAASELIEALQALAHERKIDEFYLIDRLEASLAKSYQHILDLEYDARVTIDRNTGKIYVYELVPVGDPDPETGEYTDFEERDVTPDDVSRIAALNAKNVIGSIVRDAGRQSIYQVVLATWLLVPFCRVRPILRLSKFVMALRQNCPTTI